LGNAQSNWSVRRETRLSLAVTAFIGCA